MTTVVLGVGNTLLSDEGVGVHVVERLRHDHAALDHVEFIDGGTLSFTLAGAIAGADQLIVIDAAELKVVPGTVTLFENDAMDAYLGQGKRSVHEVGLLDLLAIASLTESLPSQRALIGIQPEVIGWGDVPGAVVAAAIPQACDLALELIRKWRNESKKGNPQIHANGRKSR